MKKVVLFAMMMCLIGSMSFAATMNVIYTEPSTTLSGNTLFNLKETTIYWRQDGGVENVVKVAASNPSGGALVNRNIVVADPLPCGSTTVTVQVSASNTNTTNFESARTAIVTATKNVSSDPACSTPVPPSTPTVTIP